MSKKCPHCHEEIDYLDHLYSQRVHEKYHESGELQWVAGYDADNPDERFECPLCDETVCKTMSEAMDFWEKEDDEQENDQHKADESGL